MESKQFAWVYLIENGVGGLDKSYYGGYEFFDEELEKEFGRVWIDAEIYNKIRQKYFDKFRSVGVDWKKTKAPESTFVSEFAGTFCDPSSVEYLVGDLVLLDGTTQHWMGRDVPVTNVFDLMASIDKQKELFKKYFTFKLE